MKRIPNLFPTAMTLLILGASPSPGETVTITADSEAANHGYHWDVGVSYETGPWGISGTFIAGEREGNTADKDEDESMGAAIAVSYVLGPGIKTSFTGIWADYDSDDSINAGDVTPFEQDDGQGFGGVLALRVDF